MTLQVAAAVAKAAHDDGVSSLSTPPKDWHEYILSRMWSPDGKTTRVSGMPGQGDHPATGKAGQPLRPVQHPSGVPAHP